MSRAGPARTAQRRPWGAVQRCHGRHRAQAPVRPGRSPSPELAWVRGHQRNALAGLPRRSAPGSPGKPFLSAIAVVPGAGNRKTSTRWIGLSFIHGGLMTSLLRTGLAAAAATVLTGTFAFAAANAGRTGRVGAAGRMLPCNIYAAAHTPCVAAYSTVRALYASFDGPLYQVRRASDQAVSNIGLLRPGGAADAAAQDAFCAGTSCTISMIYDQS